MPPIPRPDRPSPEGTLRRGTRGARARPRVRWPSSTVTTAAAVLAGERSASELTGLAVLVLEGQRKLGSVRQTAVVADVEVLVGDLRHAEIAKALTGLGHG